jgi:hypothetical protein
VCSIEEQKKNSPKYQAWEEDHDEEYICAKLHNGSLGSMEDVCMIRRIV